MLFCGGQPPDLLLGGQLEDGAEPSATRMWVLNPAALCVCWLVAKDRAEQHRHQQPQDDADCLNSIGQSKAELVEQRLLQQE